MGVWAFLGWGGVRMKRQRVAILAVVLGGVTVARSHPTTIFSVSPFETRPALELAPLHFADTPSWSSLSAAYALPDMSGAAHDDGRVPRFTPAPLHLRGLSLAFSTLLVLRAHRGPRGGGNCPACAGLLGAHHGAVMDAQVHGYQVEPGGVYALVWPNGRLPTAAVRALPGAPPQRAHIRFIPTRAARSPPGSARTRPICPTM